MLCQHLKSCQFKFVTVYFRLYFKQFFKLLLHNTRIKCLLIKCKSCLDRNKLTFQVKPACQWERSLFTEIYNHGWISQSHQNNLFCVIFAYLRKTDCCQQSITWFGFPNLTCKTIPVRLFSGQELFLHMSKIFIWKIFTKNAIITCQRN